MYQATGEDMVQVSPFYGIVVKLDSLLKTGLSISQFCEEAEATLLASDEKIVSLGPCCGKEAGDTICQLIENLGLEYVSDYFTFELDLPDWLSLYASR